LILIVENQFLLKDADILFFVVSRMPVLATQLRLVLNPSFFISLAPGQS